MRHKIPFHKKQKTQKKTKITIDKSDNHNKLQVDT